MLNTNYKEKVKNFWTNDLKHEEMNDMETYIRISKEFKKNTYEIKFFEDFRILTIPEGIEEIPTKLREFVSYNFNENELDETIKNVEEKRYIMYLSPEAHKTLEIEGAVFKKLDESDIPSFKALKERTTEEDDEESFVEMDHPVIFGCYYDNKLVSVSSNLNWGEHLADIGILTDSDYRKKGFGKATVNALCAWNIEQDKINQYRCDAENTRSFRTAKRLGFEVAALVYRFKTEIEE